MKLTLRLVAGIVLLIVLAILGPFLIVWSLNVLFPALAIGYTIETWAAVIVLYTLMRQLAKG